jgi:hypothetical protein
MNGKIYVHVKSAELYDVNNYSFDNISPIFKSILDTPGDGPYQSYISKPDKNAGKFPKWNEKFEFDISSETQLCIDIYDDNPDNTRSVIKLLYSLDAFI